MRGRPGRIGALLVASWVLGLLALSPSSVGAQEPVNVEVRMTEFSFDPMTIEVPLGGTVTWIYDDTQCDALLVCPGHDTVAEVNGPDGEPLWRSETIKEKGATFTATMTQVGEIPYICTIHQSALADMDGVVKVVAAAAEPDSGTEAPSDSGTAADPTAGSEGGATLPATGVTEVATATGIAALLLVLALALRAAVR